MSTNATDPAFVGGTIIRVSVAADGSQGEGDPSFTFGFYASGVSADGRYVLFGSYGGTTLGGQTSNSLQENLKDVQTGAVTTYQGYDGRLSADGHHLAYVGSSGLYEVVDLTTGTTAVANTTASGAADNGGPQGSARPDISGDGRYVVFTSSGTNLVAGLPAQTNAPSDRVFVKDLLTGDVELVSFAEQDMQLGFVPHSNIGGGRYVAFESSIAAGPTDTNLSGSGSDFQSSGADIFVRDIQSGAVTLVSATPLGLAGDKASYEPEISADGRYVAFFSYATNLVAGHTYSTPQAYLRDLQTGMTTLLSAAADGTALGAFATDGNPNFTFTSDDRYVSFYVGDARPSLSVYVKDLLTGAVQVVSPDSDTYTHNFDMSPDGRFAIFDTNNPNLVPDDTNGLYDVFLQGRTADTTSPILAVTGVSGPANAVDHTASGTIDLAHAGAAVTVLDGSSVLGVTVSDAMGQWSLPFVYTGAGTGHAYQITASSQDSTGHVGTSDVFPFTVDFSANMGLFGSVTHDSQSHAGVVYALFDGLLGRVPDESGWESFVPELDRGATPHDVAQGILTSAEWTGRFGYVTQISDKAFVDTLYQVALGRAPDRAGEQNYLDALHAGASRADVALAFAVSGENEGQIADAFTTGIFVPDSTASDIARLYEGILHRSPEGPGLQAWVDQVHLGTSLKAIAQDFLDFPEYGQLHPAGLTDPQYVQDLYRGALGRAASDADAAGWLDGLSTHALDRADVAIGIAESAEAHAHLAGHIEAGWHLY